VRAGPALHLEDVRLHVNNGVSCTPLGVNGPFELLAVLRSFRRDASSSVRVEESMANGEARRKLLRFAGTRGED
jgi:hypothetical protein